MAQSAILLGTLIVLCGQEPLPRPPKALGDEDAKRVEGLEKQIAELLDGGKPAEALPVAKELESIRVQVQGRSHWESVDAAWLVKALEANSARSPEEQAEFSSVREAWREAEDLSHKGQYAEAQPLYEKALAFKRKVLGEGHPETAISYNNVALNLLYQAKYAEAQPLHERALAIWLRTLGEEHPQTAAGYSNLAANLYHRAKYAEAQSLDEKALAIRKRLLGEEHPDTATGYDTLAMNLRAQCKYMEAEALYRKALAIRIKVIGEEHRDTAAVYNNMSSNLEEQGKYAEAQPLYEKALGIWKTLLGEGHPDTLSGCNNLALNLGNQGKYAEAQPLIERTLAVTKKLLGEDHAHAAIAYINLAQNLQRQAKYAEAQPFYERAIAIFKNLLGEQHPNTAGAYSGLAMNLNYQGKYTEAQTLFEKALALAKELLGEEHAGTAKGYSNLASNLQDQSKYTEAQTLFEKALSIWKKHLGEEDTARGYNNLALNLKLQGKYVEAQPLYEKALSLRKKLLGEEHPDTVTSYHNLAVNLAAQGKLREAIEEGLLAARSFEVARLRVSTSGLGRAEFALKRSPLPALVLALAREGRLREAWDWFERGIARGLLDELSAREARHLAPEDRERERKLVEEIEAIDARLFTSARDVKKVNGTDPEPLRQKRLELQAELSAFEKHISDTYGVAEGKSYPLEKIQGAMREDEALLGWLDLKDATNGHWAVVIRSKGEPRWVMLAGSGEGGKWTEEDMALGEKMAGELSKRRLSRSLEDGTPIEKLARLRIAPVERILCSDPTPVRRLIVLPSPAVRGVPMALLADRFLVSHAPSGSVLAWIREKKAKDRQAKATSLLAIGDPDFGNKEKQDGGKEAPPPPDHGVYVSMVIPGSNAERSGIREGDVLLAYGGERLRNAEDLAPAIEKASEDASAISLWREGQELEVKVAPGKLGVRFYKRAARDVLKAEREFAMLMRGLRAGTESFEPLPGTRQEVEAIAGKFKGSAVEKLLGTEASERRLREFLDSGKLEGYRYIHFATHGVPNRERAFDSALILSKEPEPEDLRAETASGHVMDGRLTAAEIMRKWKLDAELVVLSGCQTALGRHAGGEGYLGFAQALLLSGAEAVVLSLWKVDDTATSLLMERFYENLLGERPGLTERLQKGEALREAQRWLRDLSRDEADALTKRQKALLPDKERGTVRPLKPLEQPEATSVADKSAEEDDRPYADPYFWAAFILIGDPD